MGDVIKALASGEVHAPRLKQHNEQLQDHKQELADINLKLFSLDLEDTGGLVVQPLVMNHWLLSLRKLCLTFLFRSRRCLRSLRPLLHLHHPSCRSQRGQATEARCSYFQWEHSTLKKLLGTIRYLSAWSFKLVWFREACILATSPEGWFGAKLDSRSLSHRGQL